MAPPAGRQDDLRDANCGKTAAAPPHQRNASNRRRVPSVLCPLVPGLREKVRGSSPLSNRLLIFQRAMFLNVLTLRTLTLKEASLVRENEEAAHLKGEASKPGRIARQQSPVRFRQNQSARDAQALQRKPEGKKVVRRRPKEKTPRSTQSRFLLRARMTNPRSIALNLPRSGPPPPSNYSAGKIRKKT